MKDSSKTVSEFLHKRSNTTNIGSLTRGQNNNIADRQETSETMGKVFVSVGNDIANSSEEGPNSFPSGELLIIFERNAFKFTAINECKVRYAIGRIRTAKGSGHDNIPYISSSLPYLIKKYFYWLQE